MALGQACAIFYAVAKRGGFKSTATKSKGKVKGEGRELIRFGDRTFRAVCQDGILFPVMGKEVITDRKFISSLSSKLTDEEIHAFLDYAEKYVRQFPENLCARPFQIYQRVRDEWRTEQFWEKLMRARRAEVA